MLKYWNKKKKPSFYDRYALPISNKEILLNKWANLQVLVEEHSSNKLVNLHDKKLLQLIGTSIYWINNFNSAIIQRLDEIGLTFENNFYRKLKKYFVFHSDLVVSSAKDYFFREDPVQNLDYPFLKSEFFVYDLGKEISEIILQLQKGVEYDESVIKRVSAKYFFMLQLLYEVIYNGDTHDGVFLKFIFNKDKFDAVYPVLRSNFLNIDSELSFRDRVHQLFPAMLNKYISRWGGDEISLEKNSAKTIYSKFVEIYYEKERRGQSEEISIEPLTWHIANVLWKIDALVQDAEECNSYQPSIVAAVCQYVGKMIRCSSYSYEVTSNNLYEKMFDLEIDLIDSVYEEAGKGGVESPLFWIREKESIQTKFDKLHSSFANKYLQALRLPFAKSSEVKQLLGAINKDNGVNEKSNKMEGVLQSLGAKELLNLFNLYIKTLDGATDSFSARVGVSSSGMFLAHLVNIAEDRLERPVWMFKIFPHVAVLPLHSEEGSSKEKLLVFDESIKTGFSVASYETYLQRLHANSDLCVHTIFDYSQSYERIPLLHSRVTSVFRENEVRSFSLSHDFIEDTDNISGPLFMPQPCSRENLVLIKKHLTDANGYFDASNILSSTMLCFSVAFMFSQQISEKAAAQNVTKVMLFSPSSEGRVVLLIVAFLLKVFYSLDVILTKSSLVDTKCDALRYSVDLTYNTGFTLTKGLATLFSSVVYHNVINDREVVGAVSSDIEKCISEFEKNRLIVFE